MTFYPSYRESAWIKPPKNKLLVICALTVSLLLKHLCDYNTFCIEKRSIKKHTSNVGSKFITGKPNEHNFQFNASSFSLQA